MISDFFWIFVFNNLGPVQTAITRCWEGADGIGEAFDILCRSRNKYASSDL